MRRRSVAEGLEEEAELLLGLLGAEAEHLEDLGLDVGAVDTDRAAADLVAVEDQVVGLGEHLARVLVEERDVLGARHREGVVRRDPAALGLLEEREVGDPEEAPLGLFAEQGEAVAQLQAQRREGHVGGVEVVGDEEERRPRDRAHLLRDRLAQLRSEGLRERRLPAPVLLDLGPAEALRPAVLALLDEVGELVEAAAAEALEVLGRDADALDVGRLGEDREAAALDRRRDVLELQAEANVGLVVAVAGHRLGPGHPHEGARELDPEQLTPLPRDQLLHRREDPLRGGEAHLDVDLGELGLPVVAQVLVAEAAGDLEVLVEPRDHEELLEDLRRLGESVELARAEAARDQEVARAPRRVLDHVGGLELEEAGLGEGRPGQGRELRPEDEVALERGPPQVEVAVAQAGGLEGVEALVVGDRQGRRIRRREELDRGALDLDGAGREGVVGVLAAADHLAGDRHAVLGAEATGGLVGLRVEVGAEDDLGDAGTIAEIDEDATAAVALAMHPSEEDDLAAVIARAEAAAIVCTTLLEEAWHGARM